MQLLAFVKKTWVQLQWRFDPVARLKKSGGKVGKRVFIGQDVYVELEHASLLEIADGAVISAFTKIILHDSSLQNVVNFPVLLGKVLIGANSYIGVNTTILPGSVIPEGTIIGANSLVKGVLEPHQVYVGQPVRRLCSVAELEKKWRKRMKDPGELISFKEFPRWDDSIK